MEKKKVTKTEKSIEKVIGKNKNRLKIKAIRNGDLKIKIKLDKEVVDVISNGKEIVAGNLGKELTINGVGTVRYYDKPICKGSFNRNDNINNSLFYNDSLNLFLLRVLGVENGLEIVYKGLITKDYLYSCINNFVEEFKNYYKNYVKKLEIAVCVDTIGY